MAASEEEKITAKTRRTRRSTKKNHHEHAKIAKSTKKKSFLHMFFFLVDFVFFVSSR